MATSFLDQSALQSTSAMDRDPMQGANQGVQAGIELAKAQQSWQMQRMEIQLKRQQLEQQKMEHMTGLTEKALSEQDPVVRKFRIQQIQQTGAVLGYQIPDETIDGINKSTDLQQRLLQTLPYRNVADPADRAQFIKDSMGAMMGGPAAVSDFLNKYGEQQAKLEQAQALASGKVKAAQESGTQKRISDLIPFAASPEDAQILQSGPSNPQFLDAFGRASATQSHYKAQQEGDKHDNIRSEITHRANQDSIAKQRLAETMARLKMAGKSLDLRQQDHLLKVEETVEKHPVVVGLDKSKAALDRIGDVLKPGMKWADVSAVNKDLNLALTGAARPAYGGEKDLSFKDYESWFEGQYGKIKGNEEGGPTDAQVNVLKSRIANIQSASERAQANFQKKLWSGKVNSGVIPADVAKAHYEANNPGYEFDVKQAPAAKKAAPAAPSAPAQAPAGSGKLKTPGAPFLNVMKQRIPNLEARKRFIESQGFDTSGVTE